MYNHFGKPAPGKARKGSVQTGTFPFAGAARLEPQWCVKHGRNIHMDKNKKRVGVSDIMLLAVGIVFIIGIFTFFRGCGPAEDGSWMTCHWAAQAIKGISAVILVDVVAHVIIPDARIKMGLSTGLIPLAVLAMVVPGHLINLCMMNTMRCRAVMTPGTIIMSVLVIIAAVADIIIQRKA